LGSPRAVGARLFPCVRGLTSDRPSTERCRPVSSLPRRVASSELLHCSLRPTLFGPSHLPGFLALVMTSPARVHSREESQVLAMFRPQAIAASRRFAPRSGSGACCIPEPCSGRDPAQGSSRSRSRSGSSPDGCPLAVGHARPREDLAILTSRRARLDFEALLHARAACVPAR
jgi:hypothetical protein